MKVWITKYALTRGIYEAEAEWLDSHPDTVEVGDSHFHKNEWWSSRLSAEEHARHMRDRKIVSLQRQIARLKGRSFGEKP